MADEDDLYWYDLRSGLVDRGHQKGQAHLMGPYATRQQAEQALETARARTEAWDAADDDDD